MKKTEFEKVRNEIKRIIRDNLDLGTSKIMWLDDIKSLSMKTFIINTAYIGMLIEEVREEEKLKRLLEKDENEMTVEEWFDYKNNLKEVK